MPELLEIYADRVDAYARYRPGYPPAAVDALVSRLDAGAIVADVGSGTGVLTEALLERGLTVRAIEPASRMRRAAEQRLHRVEGFTSLAGAAEATGLPASSVAAVLAGQAFHWFHPARARREFRRILRPGGFVALLWNERRRTADQFHVELEALLRRLLPAYSAVDDHDARLPASLAQLFGRWVPPSRTFPHVQALDPDGLVGRVMSASYAPGLETPSARQLARELRRLHARHGHDGVVALRYDTLLVAGPL
jgi:SAM-dependent methyltransferase